MIPPTLIGLRLVGQYCENLDDALPARRRGWRTLLHGGEDALINPEEEPTLYLASNKSLTNLINETDRRSVQEKRVCLRQRIPQIENHANAVRAGRWVNHAALGPRRL